VISRHQRAIEKSEATNHTWDLGELAAVAAVPGSGGTLSELQGFLHFCWRLLN